MKRLTYSNSMQKRRHRHKLILPLWCILLLVTGCGNLYTGDESLYDPNHQDNQGDQTQLPVMVAFSDPIYNVLTRGAGVLNPTDETNFSKRIADGTFFVYAFRRDNPNGMTYAHRRAEDADRRYCLIDGSLDEISAEECTALGLTAEQCKLHGKRAAYAGNGSFINWKSSGYIPYYNLQEEFDAFNFFAYYYDNAQVGEVKREADRICFDVTVDGSQDLMCAAAADLKALIEDVENGRKIAADYSEHIIGMILAGLAIGEHGFNILARDSSFQLFGKVGLYYIMFLAGLEMNMGDFKETRNKALVLGLLAFIVPIGIGFVANVSYLKYGVITSVLLASMYASHTLVAYPIVTRFGISRHRSVSIAVGGTAVTDTLTLLVLAVIGGLFKGETGGLFWIWLVVKVIFLGALIIYFFPRIGRWFFHRYNDNVMQFIFVLAMVFLGAGLMELVGMEGILGAFLAGLVLNRLIPHVSPLMDHLEFVGNALFIPYFLIGVGMLINLRVIFGEGDALKVAAVMIIMALTGKWIACWLTQKIYKMSVLERNLMYGLSNAQAAATLAAVLVGYNIILPTGERLLNDDVLNGTVLLILVTCVVSSLITERTARKMAMDDSQPENESSKETEKILISIANPDTIEDMVNLSLVIRDPKLKDNLLALNVINDDNNSDNLRIRSKHYLEKAEMTATEANVPLKKVTRYDLNIASGIIHSVKENEITSIITGLHRKKNITDSYFGILAEHLLNGLNCEIIISKFLIPVHTIKRIVVAIPPKAEYESGFPHWMEHFCRMGSTLGCRVHFFANEKTTIRLQAWIKKRHKQTLTDFSLLEDWNDLLVLTGQVSYDHLLVIISARPGTLSYDSSFEKLPRQLGKYFSNNSFIVLYPNQSGEPLDTSFFSKLYTDTETRHYEKVGKWFYRWFKKEG